MSPSALDELNFLLKLQACRNYRAYLSNPGLKPFRDKGKICQRLAQDGLVDFSREIIAVKPSAAGQALLSLHPPGKLPNSGPPSSDPLNSDPPSSGLPSSDPPISDLELKLLQKIAAAKRTSPSQLRSGSLTALQRDALLQSFLNRGLIEAETRLRRQQAEVWLTPQGQACLAELLNQFQAFCQRPDPQRLSKPSDAEVLELIRLLDHEQGAQNYLPLFHLRQKLQPLLSRSELDESLYRLEQSDQIELRDVVHTESYSPEQLTAAIPTRTGRLLFFIKRVTA